MNRTTLLHAVASLTATLSLGTILMVGSAVPASAGQEHHDHHAAQARQNKYRAEHRARSVRHVHLTPQQLHARNVRYHREHEARMHRHNAAMHKH